MKNERSYFSQPAIYSLILLFNIASFSILKLNAAVPNKVVIYPAPKGEALSNAYQISVNGRFVPVYTARIGSADNVKRFKAVDDLLNSAEYYDTAAFGYFDLQGVATITVSTRSMVNSAKVLPRSAGIKTSVHGRSITFKVSHPQNLTIEINGEWVKSLHLFINPVEVNIPKANTPGVIYFGPGIHDLSATVIGDNKTVYIAGGAIVRAVIGKDEKFGIEPSGLYNYAPRLFLNGHHIRLRGRGIIDAGNCPVHAGNFITIKGNDIKVEGIIIRNSCGWTVPIRQSSNVTLNNIKILGYRANSDGVDICNSNDVTVSNCFVRTNDDLIVVKTEEGEGPAHHIVVQNCILFNQLANALSLGAELRENVEDVLFTNCDIIHDQGRAWSLRVFQADASIVKNVRFENIRLENSFLLISLWVGKDVASLNKMPGSIRGVTFKNISAFGAPLNIDLTGVDSQHAVTDVTFDQVKLNGKALKRSDIKNNDFVRNIKVIP